MKFKRTFLQNNLVFFLLLIVVSSQSQIFLSGEEPAKIKWQQINTDNFQIVFSRGFRKAGPIHGQCVGTGLRIRANYP